MDVRRLRFTAALVVFALWVAALGVLAVVSGREPPRRTPQAAPAATSPPTPAPSPAGR
jgi:hypothetical protein